MHLTCLEEPDPLLLPPELAADGGRPLVLLVAAAATVPPPPPPPPVPPPGLTPAPSPPRPSAVEEGFAAAWPWPPLPPVPWVILMDGTGRRGGTRGCRVLLDGAAELRISCCDQCACDPVQAFLSFFLSFLLQRRLQTGFGLLQLALVLNFLQVSLGLSLGDASACCLLACTLRSFEAIRSDPRSNTFPVTVPFSSDTEARTD